MFDIDLKHFTQYEKLYVCKLGHDFVGSGSGWMIMKKIRVYSIIIRTKISID